MIKKFGIFDRQDNDTLVAWYTNKRIKYSGMFADRVRYTHFEVADGNYIEGYSIVDGSVVYDHTYTPPSPDIFVLLKKSVPKYF